MEWQSGCRFFHLNTPKKQKIANAIIHQNFDYLETHEYALITQNNAENIVMQYCMLDAYQEEVTIVLFNGIVEGRQIYTDQMMAFIAYLKFEFRLALHKLHRYR
jgi:hypothetical protein